MRISSLRFNEFPLLVAVVTTRSMNSHYRVLLSLPSAVVTTRSMNSHYRLLFSLPARQFSLPVDVLTTAGSDIPGDGGGRWWASTELRCAGRSISASFLTRKKNRPKITPTGANPAPSSSSWTRGGRPCVCTHLHRRTQSPTNQSVRCEAGGERVGPRTGCDALYVRRVLA